MLWRCGHVTDRVARGCHHEQDGQLEGVDQQQAEAEHCYCSFAHWPEIRPYSPSAHTVRYSSCVRERSLDFLLRGTHPLCMHDLPSK